MESEFSREASFAETRRIENCTSQVLNLTRAVDGLLLFQEDPITPIAS